MKSKCKIFINKQPLYRAVLVNLQIKPAILKIGAGQIYIIMRKIIDSTMRSAIYANIGEKSTGNDGRGGINLLKKPKIGSVIS